MKVTDTLICLDCDEVFSDRLECCPGCGSCTRVRLANWLAPLPTKEDLDREMRMQSLSRCADGILLRAAGMLQFDQGGEEPLGVGA